MTVCDWGKRAVALVNGTSAIHLAVKLAAEKIYGSSTGISIPVGDYGIISMNGNKVITGSSGGALIVPDEYSYKKAKKWSTPVLRRFWRH